MSNNICMKTPGIIMHNHHMDFLRAYAGSRPAYAGSRPCARPATVVSRYRARSYRLNNYEAAAIPGNFRRVENMPAYARDPASTDKPKGGGGSAKFLFLVSFCLSCTHHWHNKCPDTKSSPFTRCQPGTAGRRERARSPRRTPRPQPRRRSSPQPQPQPQQNRCPRCSKKAQQKRKPNKWSQMMAVKQAVNQWRRSYSQQSMSRQPSCNQRGRLPRHPSMVLSLCHR